MQISLDTRTRLAAGRFRLALAAAALAGAALGFAYGPVVAGGLAHAFSAWLLPTFMTIYLAGVALCV